MLAVNLDGASRNDDEVLLLAYGIEIDPGLLHHVHGISPLLKIGAILATSD